MRKSVSALLAAFLLAATPANTLQAQEKQLKLELNSLAESGTRCRVSFVAQNKLGTALDKATLELVVFDDKQLISQMLILELGKFPVSKTRVIQFDLGKPCSGISRLLINDFTECAGASLTPQTCIKSLKTSTRAKVEFGS